MDNRPGVRGAAGSALLGGHVVAAARPSHDKHLALVPWSHISPQWDLCSHHPEPVRGCGCVVSLSWRRLPAAVWNVSASSSSSVVSTHFAPLKELSLVVGVDTGS